MLSARFTRLINRCFSKETNFGLIPTNQKQEYLKYLEANAKVEYKKYPSLPHQDPNSPEYIHNVLDEYHDEVEVRAYNEVIDNFKHDLKVQR